MALTLAEAAKLSNDVLQAGVIETVVKESPVLQVLPFIEIVGNGLTYNALVRARRSVSSLLSIDARRNPS